MIEQNWLICPFFNSRKKNIEQRTSFDSKRLLQRTFNVDINDPEQPLLLDTEVPGSSSASKSHQKSDNLATIHSAVSSSSQQNPGKNSSSSNQKWNITTGQKGQDFGQKSQKTDPNNSENNPASGKGSPLPSGVIPSGLRSRSPQINSGWLWWILCLEKQNYKYFYCYLKIIKKTS